MWQMKITTTKNIQILILYAPFVRQKINICPIILWECTYTNLFWKVFLYMLSLHIYFLLYKEVLFGCHNFTKEDKDKYYLITLFIFLAKLFLHKCKFQCATLLFCFLKDLKSYLDTLLTSNNSKALKTVSLCHLNNIFLILLLITVFLFALTPGIAFLDVSRWA